MPNVNKGDIITISCSGVRQCYRVLEPETMLCEMLCPDTGKPTGSNFTLEFGDFGLNESMTIFTYWSTKKPSRKEVVEYVRSL